MSSLGYQLVLRTIDDRPLATTPEARRVLARTVLDIGRDHGLFVFRAADTHLHAGLEGHPAGAGRFCQRVHVALRARLGLPEFSPAGPRPFRDAWHRQSALLYVLRQEQRHGVEPDPFHEAGSLPELLGLRTVGAWLLPRVRALFPRLTREPLLELLGVPGLEEGVRVEHLREATLAASALATLEGRMPDAERARVAAVHAPRPNAGTAALARALGLDASTVRRLAHGTPDAALVAAIRRQMALRAVVSVANPARPFAA